MITKKHFKKIADILSDGYGMDNKNLSLITSRFCEWLRTENPRFDWDKFVDAVFKEIGDGK